MSRKKKPIVNDMQGGSITFAMGNLRLRGTALSLPTANLFRRNSAYTVARQSFVKALAATWRNFNDGDKACANTIAVSQRRVWHEQKRQESVGASVGAAGVCPVHRGGYRVEQALP